MHFKMKSFIFWSGVYNAGLALTLTCPPFYRGLRLNTPAPLWGWLVTGFLAYIIGVDFGITGFTPPRFFCILRIDTSIHRRAVAHSRRSFRRSWAYCRALWFG